MDIETAFTQEAIGAAGVDVSGDEENEIREMIQKICAANEVELTRDEENVAVLCFVAGRAYQDDIERIQVMLTRPLLTEYMEFLLQRGAL